MRRRRCGSVSSAHKNETEQHSDWPHDDLEMKVKTQMLLSNLTFHLTWDPLDLASGDADVPDFVTRLAGFKRTVGERIGHPRVHLAVNEVGRLEATRSTTSATSSIR